jgi:hypothetical protein
MHTEHISPYVIQICTNAYGTRGLGLTSQIYRYVQLQTGDPLSRISFSDIPLPPPCIRSCALNNYLFPYIPQITLTYSLCRIGRVTGRPSADKSGVVRQTFLFRGNRGFCPILWQAQFQFFHFHQPCSYMDFEHTPQNGLNFTPPHIYHCFDFFLLTSSRYYTFAVKPF